jgi:hypothetical protein
MTEKPSYLGLLNAVANAESNAAAYLGAWAEVTPDPDVRQILLTVAAREREQGAAFAKRINELGFELRVTEDPGLEKRMAIACSRDMTDLDKLEAVGLLDFCVPDGEPDVFDSFFRDHSIDIQTGALLGRYIAEERDTLRMVSGCASILRSRAETGAGTASELAKLEQKIDAVCRAVEELRQIVCAQSMTAGTA